MKRRTFFKKVGIAGAVAAVAPGALCAPCNPKKRELLIYRDGSLMATIRMGYVNVTPCSASSLVINTINE